MEYYLSLAARKLSESDRDRWVAAVICAEKVGKHGDFARQLAERRGTSIYRIYDLADAGRAWRELRRYMSKDERDKFRLDVFTAAWRVLKAGHPPELVAQFFREVLEEISHPVMSEVVSWLFGRFDMPLREPTPETHLKRFNALVSWGARKINAVDRPQWDEATGTIRALLKKYSAG